MMEDTPLVFQVATALAVSWAGFFVLYGLGCCPKRPDSKEESKKSTEAQESEDVREERPAADAAEVVKVEGCVMDFMDKLPADRVFTLKTLAQWDGKTLPMCVAVCGKVVDVSSSMNFTPVAGYGKLWGGKDASYALALASLKAEDVNILEWDLEELEDQNKESLRSFYKHFVDKYPIIGTLKEYEHRDFGDFLPETPPMVKGPEQTVDQATAAGEGKAAGGAETSSKE